MLHFLVIKSPAQTLGIPAGMKGRKAPTAEGLVLHHDDRHTGGGDHAGGIAHVHGLGGYQLNFPALHHGPGFLHGVCKPFMESCAADGSPLGRCDPVGVDAGVRIVFLVIPGITSMAGRTSTQTGRPLVIISRTLAFAASTRCSMVMDSIILSYFNILRICSIRF